MSLETKINDTLDYLDAEAANIRIQELENDLADERAENARLRAKLMPANYTTAPEVLAWLTWLVNEKVAATVERNQVRATMNAIKRLQDNPDANHWAVPI